MRRIDFIKWSDLAEVEVNDIPDLDLPSRISHPWSGEERGIDIGYLDIKLHGAHSD